METKAGVGMSHHRNPRVAGREAVEKALESGRVEKPDFVFMFATVGYDQQALLKAVREASGNARLSGCSGEGTIAGDEADESNFSVVVMTISSDELRFSNGITAGLKEDSSGVGRTVAKAIQPELTADTLGLFLFADGLTLNFDRLVAGLEGKLNLDHFLPFWGGTSADNWQMTRTYQYYNDHIVSDGVAWALLSGQAQVAWAINHGCITIGLEHKVTRSEGNVIYEIDGRPVLEVLHAYLTDDEIRDWDKAVVNVCLGFEAPKHMADHDEYIIRFIPAKDDSTGAITIPTEVSEGTSIWMTRRDYDKIAKGVDRIAKEVKTQLENNQPKLIFQFDCAGRGKLLFRNEQKLTLLRRLRQKLGPNVPWLGFYTYGEIGPMGHQNCFHNYTAVVTAIY